MRPPTVFAQAPTNDITHLHHQLKGPWRVALRAVMVLLSLHGLTPAQIAALLDYDPATVRRWINRYNHEGLHGLADRPRPGRPRLGGPHLLRRITTLLQRPRPWTLTRIWRYLGRPRMSPHTLYRRLRQVALWRRPKAIARGDPARQAVLAALTARMRLLPTGTALWGEDETHLHLLSPPSHPTRNRRATDPSREAGPPGPSQHSQRGTRSCGRCSCRSNGRARPCSHGRGRPRCVGRGRGGGARRTCSTCRPGRAPGR